MSAPILSIDKLSIALPDGLDRAHAVDGVSLEVHRRQIVCVVGESGSGKSVTASAVMRLLPERVLRITGGTIRLEGEDIASASPARICALRGNRMAMIFQEPLTALNPVMRVGDQIAEVLRIHKPEMPGDAIDARVKELMADVHLPDPAALARVYPHQISGGQRQRVMIAMALALEPALIIADEPTTALDVTTQAQILRLFRELLTKHDSGVLLITHDFGVVADVADHVVVMRQGQVVESGAPAKVLGSPAHRRPAPAHLHRAGAGHGAGNHRGRRSGLGARRLRAGAGFGFVRGTAAKARLLDDLRHPRPAHRLQHL